VKSDRAILDVLFPKVRAEMFRLLFSMPQKERYVRELTNMSALALCTVQDELRKLSAIGLIISRLERRHRFYRANRAHPLFSDILRIVQLSERLPGTRNSVLQRPMRFRPRNKRPYRRRNALPKNRPTQWHLFSRAEKTTA
jgi:predicted transcriptional regulator